ncbi:oxidoreductase-like protein [Xylogone sp. PMI_703]|nr:oxidoreductase-like protein [Xylogone sp. PMI_703]
MSASLLETESRHLCILCRRLKLSATVRHPIPKTRLQSRYASTKSQVSQQQAHPLGDYYAAILSQPLSKPTSTKPPASSSNSPSPAVTTFATTTSSTPPTAPEGPSILFSSRLSSPLERRSEILKKSTMIAGVLVPPRPDEPDNCCMSGCVNCVWDRYRDEMEEWAAARKEADRALQRETRAASERRKRKGKVVGSGLMLGEGEKGAQHTMTSMDDDGGGSETNWSAERAEDELFAGVPVGIREFMKTEKRLREKHMRERGVLEHAGAPTSTPAHV